MGASAIGTYGAMRVSVHQVGAYGTFDPHPILNNEVDTYRRYLRDRWEQSYHRIPDTCIKHVPIVPPFFFYLVAPKRGDTIGLFRWGTPFGGTLRVLLASLYRRYLWYQSIKDRLYES